MYYRWNESAKNLDAFKQDFAEIGVWYRVRHQAVKDAIPEFYHLVKQGYIEQKAEGKSAKQVAHRKMWQLVGRVQALAQTERMLVRELRQTYPRRFRTMSDEDVIAMFYQDAVTNDLTLMRKIYNGI